MRYNRRPMACLRLPTLLLLFTAGCGGSSNPHVDGGTDLPLVSEDLRVLGPATQCAAVAAPGVLSNLPGSHALPRIGFTGTHFVVAWNTRVAPGKHRIVATLTDRDGNKLGPNIPMTTQPLADSWAPSLTPLLGGTAIAWTRITNNKQDIVMNTLDPSGQRLDNGGLPCDPGDELCGQFPLTTSGEASFPYLARPHVEEHSGGPTDNQVGLTWIDRRNHPCGAPPCVDVSDVFWKKVQANGDTLVPDKQITAPGSMDHNTFPRMAFDGAKNGIVWRSQFTEFVFATLDNMGQIGSGPTKIGKVSGSLVSAGSPDLVWTGTDYALATTNGSDTSASVIFQRFQSNGIKNLGPIGVTFDGVACTPAIAWNGEHFGVVWQTHCGQPGSDLAFELVDTEGYRLRANGTRCDTDPTCGVTRLTSNTTAIAAFPEIAWAGGRGFAVTWMMTDSNADAGAPGSQVYFSRIDCASP